MPLISLYLKDEIYMRWKDKIKKKPALRAELREIMHKFIEEA